MHCCKHPHTVTFESDPRFADDDFTRAALSESRARAAHAHAVSFVVALLGGLLLFGLFRRR